MVAPRMSLKFLGTSSMPNSMRNYSSLLFKLDNHTVMVDCGEGTQRQLRSRYIGGEERLANLKTILITHLHADHVLGLVPMLMSIMGPTGVPVAPDASPRVEIYGPPGLRALIRTTSIAVLCAAQRQVRRARVRMAVAERAGPWRGVCVAQPARAQHPRHATARRRGERWPRPAHGREIIELAQLPLHQALIPVSGRTDQRRAHLAPLPHTRERGIRHPLSLLSTLTTQRQSVHLPDGTVLDPPPLTFPGRKVTIMGDTSDGTGGFTRDQLRAGCGLPALAHGLRRARAREHQHRAARPPQQERQARFSRGRCSQGKAARATLYLRSPANSLRSSMRDASSSTISPQSSPARRTIFSTPRGTSAESAAALPVEEDGKQLGDPERRARIMKQFELQAFQAWQAEHQDRHAAAPVHAFARPWEQSQGDAVGNGLKRKHPEVVDAENVWDPSPFLLSSGSTPVPRYALVLLNSPIDARQTGHFRRLWASASLRLCADGAANRLLDAFGPSAFDADLPLPHAILGDLDSILPSTQQFFESKGVAVHKRPSQYATDLQKTIQQVEDHEDSGDEHTLIIYGGLAGAAGPECAYAPCVVAACTWRGSTLRVQIESAHKRSEKGRGACVRTCVRECVESSRVESSAGKRRTSSAAALPKEGARAQHSDMPSESSR
ncbi:hypothetical protein L1887_50566 [Cichorium endivia]|nr:hypothetical protein L1887_50566 [Cichorium endivia]